MAPASGAVGDVASDEWADRVRAAYDDVRAPLWRSLVAWSGSTDVADEALAESFAQLLRRGDEVRDPAAWAWRSAFRLAAGDLQRRRQAAGRHVDGADAVERLAGRVDRLPDDALDLVRALAHLSDQQRRCIALVDVAGHTAPSAAAVLGTSAATVRVQLMRAGVVAGPGPGDLDPPTALWGRTWQLSKITVDGKEQPVVPNQEGAPVRLDAAEEGRLSFNLCGLLGGATSLEAGRLRSELWAITGPCPPNDMLSTLTAVFGAGPSVEVADDQLTLTIPGPSESLLIDGPLPTELVFLGASTFDPPSAIWDRTWTATRFVDDGKDRSIERQSEPAGPLGITFDSGATSSRTTEGPGARPTPGVFFRACNSVGIGLALRGERLVAEGRFGSTLMACSQNSSEAFLTKLFRDGATVEVRSDRAILRSGADRIELVDLAGKDRAIESPAFDPPSAMWGRQWRISELTDDGMYEGGEYASIDARKEGRLLLSACDTWPGATAPVARSRSTIAA